MCSSTAFVLLLLQLLVGIKADFEQTQQRCQEAERWPLRGRPLVRDYRGRVLLLVFVSLQHKCEPELNRLDALPKQFPDVRVLAIVPRGESARAVRAFAWQFPRIRFEQESAESPVWQWFRAKHLERHIFDRCSRHVAQLLPSADFAVALSVLGEALSGQKCGRCDAKHPQWPSFHPPVPIAAGDARRTKANPPTLLPQVTTIHAGGLSPGFTSSMLRGGVVEESGGHLRRWNSPPASPSSTGGSHQRRSGEQRPQENVDAGGVVEQRQRLHWTVGKEQSLQKSPGDSTVSGGSNVSTTVMAPTVYQPHNRQQKEQKQHTQKQRGPIVLSQQQQLQYPARYHNQPQQKLYLYGQQLNGGQQYQQQKERERMLRERERMERERQQQWAAEQQRLRAQQQQQHRQIGPSGHEQQAQPPTAPRGTLGEAVEGASSSSPLGGVRYSKDPYRQQYGMRRAEENNRFGHNWQQRQQQHHGAAAAATPPATIATTTTTTAEAPDPAPLYPEGSENAGGEDYYGDEYAAEWTTEAPEAAMQIPRPTKPAAPTTPTTQTDKNFGFELPCTGFNDESCFQQQSQLRPNEVHRCCRGRILFSDQCVPGKCANATNQLCCIQRFLQAKLSCCSDERQAETDVGDHFSRCCFENFVDGDDPCCPRAYAAEQWRSVHELCLPNVEMDLSGVRVPAPLTGTSLTTQFDFSKTDKWRFECRYGGHVQQYSYFEESASREEEEEGTGAPGEEE